MRKNFVGPALGIALGAALFFIGGEWIGALLAVLGLVFLVLEWRKAEKSALDSPDLAAVLTELERDADRLEQQLAQAELDLENFSH